LLEAADRLANSKNLTIQKPWQRYRPLLYLTVDSGITPKQAAWARNAIRIQSVCDCSIAHFLAKYVRASSLQHPGKSAAAQERR
jgi:hypothetical protein